MNIHRILTSRTFAATVLCGLAASFLALAQPIAAAEKKKKRIGPPPKVYNALPNQCARCHKKDGRGGPAYGGFAADLRATELDFEGLVFIITTGVRQRGMPEFKSTLSKREIEGIATYILEKVKDHYYDKAGNRITAEEAAALDPRLNDGSGRKTK